MKCNFNVKVFLAQLMYVLLPNQLALHCIFLFVCGEPEIICSWHRPSRVLLSSNIPHRWVLTMTLVDEE